MDDDGSIVKIPESLHAALCHFRLKDQVRALWADAACIDQRNTDEKSSQVANMHVAFREAKKVQIWLGPGETADPIIFCTLPAPRPFYDAGDVTREEILAQVLTGLSMVMTALPACACCGDRFGLTNDPAIQGLLEVFNLRNRLWFSRLWTAQEIWAVRSEEDAILCSGHHTAHWSDFKWCFLLLSLLADGENGVRRLLNAGLSLREIDGIRMDYSNFSEGVNVGQQHFDPRLVLYKMCRLRSRNCSEPLDRLYALNHMLFFNEMPELRPNYALSVSDAYSRLVISCLSDNATGELSFFGRGQWSAILSTESNGRDKLKLPSWVPNLHGLTNRSEQKVHLYSRRYEQRAQFRPSTMLFQVFKHPQEPKILWIKGMTYATVKDVCPNSYWPELSLINSGEHRIDDLRRLRDWLARCRKFLNKVWTTDELKTNFVELLLCGMADFDGERPQQYTGTHYDDLKSFFARNGHRPDGSMDLDNASTEGDDLLGEFLGQTKYWDLVDHGRQLSYIEGKGEGRKDVGWIPASAREGDSLCLIAGAEYPFVVRDRGDGSYEMLGDAYTSQLTLKEALGGVVIQRCVHAVNQERPRGEMDWNEDSREMARLLRGLTWIRLR